LLKTKNFNGMILAVTVTLHWIKGFLEEIRAPRMMIFHGSVRSANDARR
jgi:hypothetical protein